MKPKTIGAIILAAGLSKRMGQSKLLLPWKNTTVIEHIIAQVQEIEASPIVIVTGKQSHHLDSIISKTHIFSTRNMDYEDGSMLHSVQKGIEAIFKFSVEGFFIVLGDQPALDPLLMQTMVSVFKNTKKRIILPIFEGHKGHPWLLSTSKAELILRMDEPENMRTFLRNQSPDDMELIQTSNPTILLDIDNPTDYESLIKKTSS